MIEHLRKYLPDQHALYDASPRLMQRAFVNVEAWRRDWFRRHGDYQAEMALYNPAWYRSDAQAQAAEQLERLAVVIAAARQHVPYYRRMLPDLPLRSLADLQQLPILEKAAIRRDLMAFVRDGASTKEMWLQATSGSTGTPMHYYHDRSTVRAHYAAADALLAMHGCVVGERRVRFSGAYVAPYTQTEPPFWIYIDHYRQLQCSAYHLSPTTYHAYLKAIREARVIYGTGYATAWHLLASYLLESGEEPPTLKAIFTDSEGMNQEQQATTERAFRCPVFQTYGLGEVHQVSMQCDAGRYHVLTRSCLAEILDDHDRPVRPGETGQVIVTDLTNLVTPFIRYRTGDLATLAPNPCTCGWQSPSWTEIVGRVDDQLKTPEGRWIGRLSHVTKPGVGIRESQIVQTAINQVVIRVVPDVHFDGGSMDAVVAAAHRYLGDSMHVSWEVVDALPRTPSGKLRHVVRLIRDA